MTPLDLLDRCLERIDRLEKMIQAWVVVDREGARRQAERRTDELRRGFDRGPLHGIPVGVKDIFDVFDLPTAAGSKRWAQSFARRDSIAVARLRQAGAVILGKTVTVAYAAFDPSVTRNPWHPERTPGGSSSGSAAAVACGMCPIALGTQTGGSITRPASFCGVAGFKPTFGDISLEGVLPLAPSFDHAGLLAGSVEDVSLGYRPLAGSGAPIRLAPRTSPCRRPGEVIHLGLPGGLFCDQAESLMNEAFDALIERLRSQGVIVTEVPLPPGVTDIARFHRLIMAVEAYAYHGERWERFPDDYPPRLTALLQEGEAARGAEVAVAYRHLQDMRQELARNFPASMDAWIAPATEGPPPDRSTTGTPLFQAPWSYLGLPTVSMPFAWTEDGLPLCLQLAGRHGGEMELLALAVRLETLLAVEQRDVLTSGRLALVP